MTRGNKVFAKPMLPMMPLHGIGQPVSVNDLFLHALFARIALRSGENVEFRTIFDKASNTIELDIKDQVLPIFDQVIGMQRGPKFKQFIDWLIGSYTLPTTDGVGKDQEFISATELETWVGATSSVIDDTFLLVLPTKEVAVVGYNLKTLENFTGSAVISLVWMFLNGVNTDYDLLTTVRLSALDGSSLTQHVANHTISTFNLIAGDIRETELITVDPIELGGNILNILVHRNNEVGIDPLTESIGVIGLKVRLLS